jgi:hypothetical protein
MALRVGTKPYRTAIMSITSWMDGCIIPTATIATTTDRYSWPK